ncbi:hypothetical protein [Ruminococcus flavefaciens]|uniref:hypothetical protein n=1 Tax=Ruminococcus flavefaciens TaxID=1265 RepID=UPI001568381A|nr:hypothetical protein [Ruminococcus flavefaciens]
MKWVIRRISDNMYAVSHRFFVYQQTFARRFRTRKQAEAYMISAGFDRCHYNAEVLQVETDKSFDKDRIAINNIKE